MTNLIDAINADTAIANNTLTVENLSHMLRHHVCDVSESDVFYNVIEIDMPEGMFAIETDGRLIARPATVEENPRLACMFGTLQGIEMMLKLSRHSAN